MCFYVNNPAQALHTVRFRTEAQPARSRACRNADRPRAGWSAADYGIFPASCTRSGAGSSGLRPAVPVPPRERNRLIRDADRPRAGWSAADYGIFPVSYTRSGAGSSGLRPAVPVSPRERNRLIRDADRPRAGWSAAAFPIFPASCRRSGAGGRRLRRASRGGTRRTLTSCRRTRPPRRPRRPGDGCRRDRGTSGRG